MSLLSFIQLQKCIVVKLKLMVLYCLSFLCLLFVPAQAFSFAEAGIEVTGQGSIVVTPNAFALTLTVTERGRVPSKLQALVDKKSNSVINAAKSLNISKQNISSARVNLRIVEEKPSIEVHGIEVNNRRQGSVYINGQSINQQASNNQYKQPLFELSRQITVNFDEVDDYDNFLARIIKINVSHISPLSMDVAERDEFYQQALLQAISHAKSKAQRMAKQAGASIDKLLVIKELSSNHYQPMYAQAMMSDGNVSTHKSLIGDQTISARVLVKFSLKD